MRTVVAILAGVTPSLCFCTTATAGQVQQIASFGNNPTGIGMYLYVPSNVAAKPAILVGVHACHGKGTDVCSQGSGWATQADKYGFVLICPSAVSSDGCWDVHSTADLTHNGGGDASGIISMVNYVVQNKNGDANRVYVAGHSSGGMMTNVLIGSYPDVFKAGAAFAGVAFGCYAIGSVDSLGWNSTCANGNVTQTGMQWGDTVRAAYPGFTGTRPPIQLWHGTADATVNFNNLREEIKEWTNVLGVSATPATTETSALQPTWIRTRYTDSSGVVQVEAIQETGQPHNLVVDQAEAIHFFRLDGTSPVFLDAGVKDTGTNAPVGTDASAGGADAGFGSSGSSSGAGSSGSGVGGSDAGGSGSTGSSSGAGAAGGGPSGSGGGQFVEEASVDSSAFAASDATAGSAGAPGQAIGRDGGGGSGGCAIAVAKKGERGWAERNWPVWLLVVVGIVRKVRRRARPFRKFCGPTRTTTTTSPRGCALLKA